ncbi:unnamed protein product [Ixodes hexagonus]
MSDDSISKEALVVVRRDETPSPIQPQSEFLQEVQAGATDYVLLTTVLPNTYTLTLTDGSRCFKGDANATSQDIQVSSLTRSALTTGSGDRFAYSVDVVGDDALRFTWKQVLDDQQGGPRRKLGSTVLRHVREGTNRSVMEVLAGAVRVVRETEARQARTADQLERLRHDHDRALDQLEQCARTKQSLESELYSKFALVLNSKKRRIAELLGEQTTRPADEPMAGSEDEPVVQQAASRHKEKPVAKPVTKQTTKSRKRRVTAKRVTRPATSSTWQDRSESDDEPMAGSDDESVAEAAVQQGTSRQKKSSVAKPAAIQMTNREIEKSTSKHKVRQTSGSTSGDWLESDDEPMAGSEDESVAEPVVQQVTGRQKSSEHTTNRRVERSEGVARQTTSSTRVDGSVAKPVAEQTVRSRRALQSTSVHDLIESLI